MDRSLLRFSATTSFAGVLISLIAGLAHPGAAPANDHAAAFAEYAQNSSWTAIHLGQFVGMAAIIAGLLSLSHTIRDIPGTPTSCVRLGAIFAAGALALYGVLQAVDGVALKQAVDAWALASDAEKVSRFAAAEAVRWLEWGVRSYQSFVLGVAFALLGLAMTRTRTALTLIGYVLALSGAGFIAQGWILGLEGFSVTNSIPTLLTIALTFLWSTWLLIAAWRMPEPSASTP